MTTNLLSRLSVLTILLTPFLAHAAPSACPQHYAAAEAPDLLNEKLSPQTTELCNLAFATLHSGLTRGPLFSAEHLTRDSVAAAKLAKRDGTFHPDDRIATSQRATMADYARSGFDRGHMAPSGDMPSAEAQQESFSLSNMVPQAPTLNRGLWARIEAYVRAYAAQHGEVYVVTGPAFVGGDVATVGNVLVPTYTWKAVFDPINNVAWAYIADNDASGIYRRVSISELEDVIKIKVFPRLPEGVRLSYVDLPPL